MSSMVTRGSFTEFEIPFFVFSFAEGKGGEGGDDC